MRILNLTQPSGGLASQADEKRDSGLISSRIYRWLFEGLASPSCY
jgi:hypothetical protein